MMFRWGPRLAIAFAIVSIGLHVGFYLSSRKGQSLRLIGITEYVPMAIASWTVSKALPACFPNLRQVVLFEALVPILAGMQGFLLGLGVDALMRLRAAKTR
jgi:hypothetical protein